MDVLRLGGVCSVGEHIALGLNAVLVHRLEPQLLLVNFWLWEMGLEAGVVLRVDDCRRYSRG